MGDAKTASYSTLRADSAGARLGAEEPLLARFGRLLEPMAAARHVSRQPVDGELDQHALESVAVTDAVALAAQVSMLILQQ